MTDKINSTTTAAEAWRIHRAERAESNSVNENQTPSTPASELERQSVEPLVCNAVTCGICQSPADRYSNMFVCQANPSHLGDLNVGTFSDLTPPNSEVEKAAKTSLPSLEGPERQPSSQSPERRLGLPFQYYPNEDNFGETEEVAGSIRDAHRYH